MLNEIDAGRRHELGAAQRRNFYEHQAQRAYWAGIEHVGRSLRRSFVRNLVNNSSEEGGVLVEKEKPADLATQFSGCLINPEHIGDLRKEVCEYSESSAEPDMDDLEAAFEDAFNQTDEEDDSGAAAESEDQQQQQGEEVGGGEALAASSKEDKDEEAEQPDAEELEHLKRLVGGDAVSSPAESSQSEMYPSQQQQQPQMGVNSASRSRKAPAPSSSSSGSAASRSPSSSGSENGDDSGAEKAEDLEKYGPVKEHRMMRIVKLVKRNQSMGGPAVTVQVQYVFDDDIEAYQEHRKARLARPLAAPEIANNDTQQAAAETRGDSAKDYVMRRERNLAAQGTLNSPKDMDAPGSRIANRYQNRQNGARARSTLVMNSTGILSYMKNNKR